MKPFPELTKMIATAKRFLAGELHFSYLAGDAAQLQFAAKAYSAHPSIRRMADEWALMTDRCWNEYGQHRDTITVTELRDWVREQLAVLQPALPIEENEDQNA